jgi:predicted RNase H-like nuclease (RuvC/YqgF family)
MGGRPREPRSLEEKSVEKVLEELARRSSELVVGLARLDARVTQLEERLDALLAECARLVRRAEKTAAARRPARSRREAPLRLPAGSGADAHAPGLNGDPLTPTPPLRLIA